MLGLETPLTAMVEGLEAAGRESGEGPEIRIVVRDPDEFALACEIFRSLKAGTARRDEESQLAEDYLAQLMAELEGD